jgi:RND family efflux transporter MFP subunit
MADTKSKQDTAANDPDPVNPNGEVRRPSRRGATVRLFLLLLLLIAAGALYRYWGFWETEQQQAQPPAPEVTVATPLIRELIDWAEFTGQFQAKESVEIRARVSGYLESIQFEDGQLVKKGDPLFVIEPRPYELALESAKANLSEAKANLHLANVQLERTSQLREKDFAAQATLDEREATVETAQAAVESMEAALGQAQLNLDYTTVVAPMSGRVSRHEVSVGNLIMGGTGGSTTLLTNIVMLDPIHFVFDISEADGVAYQRMVESGELADARAGKVQVEGQLMDETKWTLHGVIDFVDNQYNASTGTIRVRAVYPNPDMFIQPGQFGRVRVPMSKRQPQMLIPDAAIVTDQTQKMVFTVDEDNKIVPKQVELGPIFGDNLRMIRSGLEKTDRVVIDGLIRARPGAPVTPKEGTIDGSSVPQ